MPPKIDGEECVCCGTCVDVCPEDVYFSSESDEVPVVTYPQECWHCNACVLDCPSNAVSLRLPLPMMLCHK